MLTRRQLLSLPGLFTQGCSWGLILYLPSAFPLRCKSLTILTFQLWHYSKSCCCCCCFVPCFFLTSTHSGLKPWLLFKESHRKNVLCPTCPVRSRCWICPSWHLMPPCVIISSGSHTQWFPLWNCLQEAIFISGLEFHRLMMHQGWATAVKVPNAPTLF